MSGMYFTGTVIPFVKFISVLFLLNFVVAAVTIWNSF